MSKVMTIAKFTLAFVIIAGGFSLIMGTLIGGGVSRSYDELRGKNTDPRSILVQAVLIEADASVSLPSAIPPAGSHLSDSQFRDFAEAADALRATDGAHVRTPAMLIQHSESGSIALQLGDLTFDTAVSPSVIEVKHGNVLRVALQIQRVDTDSSAAPRSLSFATAYTSAPGSAVVLDLADLGQPGSRAVLALRTTLIDPSPRSQN